jgi:hypothetical protein
MEAASLVLLQCDYSPEYTNCNEEASHRKVTKVQLIIEGNKTNQQSCRSSDDVR